MAVTAILLPSCGLLGRGGSQGGQTVGEAADSTYVEDMDSLRRAILEELLGEDYNALPDSWTAEYQRRFKREREKPAAEETDSLVFTTPLEIIPTDSLSGDGTPAETDAADSTATGRRPGTVIPAEDTDIPEGDSEDGDVEEDASGAEEKPVMKTVDYETDLMRNLQITEDSSAVLLLGNVMFYHNGTVITCDSAVRFSEKRMELYKRVIINSGTTYVYGDRAEYNGEVNLARVYSPIVKVVDQDAVLYTYNFSYNTYTEIGRYWGGSTLTHNDNQMESLRGYYNTQSREFTGAGEVELTNPDYKLVSDSVLYNLDTEIAEFFVPSTIWNSKGEIIQADRGKYRIPSEDYDFSGNSYILTADQEIWADSMEYFSATDNTVMYRDIQIIDEENSTMAFGDYGEYWGETEHGMLTRDPSLLSFDSEAEKPDTIYMRSDSMFFYTYPYDHVFEGLQNAEPEDRTSEFEERIERPVIAMPDSLGSDSLARGELLEIPEGEEQAEELIVAEADHDEQPIAEEPDDGGPLEVIPDPEPALSKRQQRRAERQAARNITEEASTPDNTLPAPEESEADGTADPAEQTETADDADTGEPDYSGEETDGEEEATDVPVPELYESPYGELTGILHRMVAADSTQRAMSPEEFWLHVRDEIAADSGTLDYYAYAVDDAMASGEVDTEIISVPTGGLEAILETVITESERVAASVVEVQAAQQAEEQDSVQRVFCGYHDVRIFREDFQAVCDSIIGFSKDSTMHLHIDPVMWSDRSQIVSDIMIIYTRDEQLYKAEFYGSPFMSQEVDSTLSRFNQIRGRFMTSWFRNNDIYKHDVFGNTQSLYYEEDDNTGEIENLFSCESVDATFLIEENQIEEITYRGKPDFAIYPIDMIPPDVDPLLPGFTWQPHRRPMNKEAVFNRVIRPRRRLEVMNIPQPEFPLTESINERKEELIRLNMWRDRNDTLSPDALDFVQRMELKYSE